MPTPSTSSPTTKVGLTNSQVYDALLAGVKWGGAVGAGATITYSFPWVNGASAIFSGPNGAAYSTRDEPNATVHYALSSIQQDAVRGALQSWANVANLKLVEVADTASAVGDIRVAWTSASSITSTGKNAWGWAYYPSSTYADGGDIWIGTTSSGATDSKWSSGSYNYQALIHELGHALGLKHPFDGTATLSDTYDNRLYTVMAYDDPPNSLFVDVTDNGRTHSWVSYTVSPETPMVYDIAVMQYLYGANMSYHSGDDVYTFDPATPFFRTIWDAGGNDTISVANFTHGSLIDLRPGQYSSLYIPSDTGAGYSWTKAPPKPTYDGSNNLGIAFGAVIENAIGGSGDDTIWGNGANNRLQGNGGINILDGGDGVDTAAYTGNFSDYTITAANGSYVVAAKASGQTDRITHIERLAFKDATLALSLAGLAEDTVQAQYAALAQKFYVAYFGRPADAAGLASMVEQFTAAGVPASTAAFVDAYRSNAVVKALIDSFGNSAESAALYHGSNREFVTAVYDNLLGRAPDLDGLNFWSAGVDAGLARGVAVLNMVAGAEGNQTAQGLIDATLLTNRVTVASNFTSVLDTPAEAAKYAGAAAAAAARSLLDGVDHNTSILNYESNVLNLVAQLPAGTAAQLVGVQAAGHDGWLA